MILTSDDVKEILHLLDASPSNELHLHTERFKLAVRRGADGVWTQEMQITSPANLLRPVAAASAPAESVEPAKADLAVDGQIDVRAPLVGTFYRAPKPGAPPFVEVGSRVEKETVVAIIETMKLMNSVYAGTRGKIVEICQKNGHFVEQDAVLMRIEPEEGK